MFKAVKMKRLKFLLLSFVLGCAMLAGRYEYAPDITNWTSIYNYDGTYKSIKDNVFSGAYNIIANINNFLYYLEVNREVITDRKSVV